MHFLQRLFPVRSRESFSWFLVMERPHPSQATSPSAMGGFSGLPPAGLAASYHNERVLTDHNSRCDDDSTSSGQYDSECDHDARLSPTGAQQTADEPRPREGRGQGQPGERGDGTRDQGSREKGGDAGRIGRTPGPEGPGPSPGGGGGGTGGRKPREAPDRRGRGGLRGVRPLHHEEPGEALPAPHGEEPLQAVHEPPVRAFTTSPARWFPLGPSSFAFTTRPRACWLLLGLPPSRSSSHRARPRFKENPMESLLG